MQAVQQRVEWGAPRIRAHFLKISGRGVAPCDAEESKLKPAVAALKKIEEQSKGMLKRGAQKRQLDKATESAAPAAVQDARKQRILTECMHGVMRPQSRDSKKASDGSARVLRPRRLFS